MIVWILAIVLMASLAALGFRQGAIRVAFSFVGIIVAALFALLLGKLVRLLFPIVGIKDPVVVWLVPPVIAFAIVLTLFKVAGLAVHKRVEVHFKYRAGDLRFALWERLNRRVGACLGLANALAYMVLLSFAIYVTGYWTTQLAAPDNASPWTMRYFNRISQDLESTGLARVGAAVSSMPDDYFEAANLLGMIYHNPLVQDRLATYPALLTLAERPDFSALGGDGTLGVMRLKQAPFGELLKQPSLQAIANNPDTLKLLWNTVKSNLKDLEGYLRTGTSKYDADPIIGYWDFDVGGALSAYRRAKAQVQPNEMRQVKQTMMDTLSKVTLILAPDSQAYLKDFPQPGAGGAPASTTTIQGTWEKSASGYDLSMTLNGQMLHLAGAMDGDRLTFSNPLLTLVFMHE